MQRQGIDMALALHSFTDKGPFNYPFFMFQDEAGFMNPTLVEQVDQPTFHWVRVVKMGLGQIEKLMIYQL